MSIPRHDPPGFVTDLKEENRQGWSDEVRKMLDDLYPEETPHYYDATRVKEEGTVEKAAVTWIGFPNRLANPNNITRWKKADSARDYQDEYLEWSIERDSASGKIKKIVFCNEGPNYFEYLAKVQPETVLKLYQDLHPGVPIKKEDIFDSDGKYIKRNKWNDTTTTVQKANTLDAEVQLAAEASILRKNADGSLVTDSDDLIRFGWYGNPCRNSDPKIGSAVNGIARGGYHVTIQNPVGLYINAVDWTQVSPPDGHDDDDPQTFWKWTRGTSGLTMRGEFEVPPEKGYLVGDLYVKDVPLDYGAQIADLITIVIHARYWGPNTVPSDAQEVNINDKDTRACPDITAAINAQKALYKPLRGRLN